MLSFELLEPRPRVRSLAWFREHIQTHEGRPYDHGAYPHIGAPGGPCDALDDPAVSTIWLQWGSRLGKTFFGQCANLFTADVQPCPMMFASSSETLAVQVVERTYKMLEKCGPLKDQLRPKNRRRQNQIDLLNCRTYVAWARSVSTLADKAVRFGHANEIDKWEHLTTSKEADPLKLFDDRFKEFPSHKKVKESTPSVKGRSRIERGRLYSTNCQFHVPCPFCERYQVLSIDRIKWEKNSAGKSDKDIARRTAYYECAHCQAKLLDEHRAPMIRRGVWVPEGCGVDDAKAKAVAEHWSSAQGGDGASLDQVWRGWEHAEWITGKPARNGPDAGYQLSSIYALTLGWGEIAAEFVGSKDKPHELRNFINQWLGETWEITERKETWEVVGKRLIDPDIRYGIVPPWASLLTMGVDRQQTDNKHPWTLDAWGPGRRSATIAYGECFSLEEIEELAKQFWPHADGGDPLRVSMVLIDSGNRPLGVFESCERLRAAGIPAMPCKGSNHALNSDYDVVTLGRNTAAPGSLLCHVDTIRSQLWLDRAIYDANPREEGGFAIYHAPLEEHEYFLLQLMNDAPISKLDSTNNVRESWQRIDETLPNDLRDCKRYSYTGMLLSTHHGPIAARGAVMRRAAREAVEPRRVRELKFRRR